MKYKYNFNNPVDFEGVCGIKRLNAYCKQLEKQKVSSVVFIVAFNSDETNFESAEVEYETGQATDFLQEGDNLLDISVESVSLAEDVIWALLDDAPGNHGSGVYKLDVAGRRLLRTGDAWYTEPELKVSEEEDKGVL